ncbi:unnamed protein product [Acanthoscelides obtectus]|uniref:Uncharacterized protein n=1 Tax=Acanthoscelides obtectus TaxID=200917 RepID=A0A9P0KLJ7_ACAOB|nr:unnamed protein product [Acanthoscelides obtectus]CAK1638202.1 hypothetical protein AOBTE_LOCUS10449 [Acanthoscelides obtectus]
MWRKLRRNRISRIDGEIWRTWSSTSTISVAALGRWHLLELQLPPHTTLPADLHP